MQEGAGVAPGKQHLGLALQPPQTPGKAQPTPGLESGRLHLRSTPLRPQIWAGGGQPGNNCPRHRARAAPSPEFLPKSLGGNLKAGSSSPGAWTHPFLPGHLLAQA